MAEQTAQADSPYCQLQIADLDAVPRMIWQRHGRARQGLAGALSSWPAVAMAQNFVPHL